jgi:hypothetical protein
MVDRFCRLVQAPCVARLFARNVKLGIDRKEDERVRLELDKAGCLVSFYRLQ